MDYKFVLRRNENKKARVRYNINIYTGVLIRKRNSNLRRPTYNLSKDV